MQTNRARKTPRKPKHSTSTAQAEQQQSTAVLGWANIGGFYTKERRKMSAKEFTVSAFEQMLTGDYIHIENTSNYNWPKVKAVVMSQPQPFRAKSVAAFMGLRDTTIVTSRLNKWEQAKLLCKLPTSSGSLWVVRNLLSKEAQEKYDKMIAESLEAQAITDFTQK